MKKEIAMLLGFALLLPLLLNACGVEQSAPVTEGTTTSYKEKVSYYDELARGDYERVVATTAASNIYAIEGDVNSMPKDIFEEMVNVINLCYTNVFSYLSSGYQPKITIILDYSNTNDEPNHVVGETLVVNVNWLIEHPDDVDSLIYGFAGIAQNYPRKDMPGWMVTSIRYYVRDRFAIYRDSASWSLPKKYQGGSYLEGKEVGAAFLKWISGSKKVDIVGLLNRELKKTTVIEADFWREATGRTLEQLWEEYKAA